MLFEHIMEEFKRLSVQAFFFIFAAEMLYLSVAVGVAMATLSVPDLFHASQRSLAF